MLEFSIRNQFSSKWWCTAVGSYIHTQLRLILPFIQCTWNSNHIEFFLLLFVLCSNKFSNFSSFPFVLMFFRLSFLFFIFYFPFGKNLSLRSNHHRLLLLLFRLFAAPVLWFKGFMCGGANSEVLEVSLQKANSLSVKTSKLERSLKCSIFTLDRKKSWKHIVMNCWHFDVFSHILKLRVNQFKSK